ncbi:MAG: HEAT repeat domain-containing protein [Candidatus Wallbacteria bacterium]|nr:HEAT repeat domain-containing protein [Candidatus Wallbacteria bacterium]
MHPDLDKCLSELEDLREDVRAKAVAALGKIEDPVTFLALDRISTADPSIQLRFTAKKTTHQLQETIQRRPPDVRVGGDPAVLQALLGSSDPTVRKKCLELCLATRQMAAIPLIPPLLENEPDPEVKRAALLLAALAGRHAIRVLAPFIADPEVQVRWAAVTALGIIDDVDMFPYAVRALSDPAPEVQKSAFRICSRIGKANFGRLLEHMVASTKPWKRLAAVLAIVRVRQPHLRPMAERSLQDPDPQVRQAAASALEALGEKPQAAPVPPRPPASAPPSVAAADAAPVLPPTASATRPSAQQSRFAKLKNPQAGGPAAPAPSSSAIRAATFGNTTADAGKTEELNAWVRETDTARVPEIVEWFEKETDARIRASLVMAAGKLGGKLATEMLKSCLSDADGRIRANAVEALRGKVRSEALAGLVHDADNRCRANAIVALKDYRRVDIIKALKAMASGDATFRKSCIYAIVEIATPQTAELLKMFDDDLDPDVKEKARQARELLDARLAEAAAAQAAGGAPGAGNASGKGEPAAGKLDGLKSRIAEAFGAFRKKLGG